MRVPLARVLSIGDELVLGRTVDTNATHISRSLSDCGVRVERAIVVGDRQADIVAAMRDAARHCDLIVASGGLGPTDDDRTRHALAEAMRVPLAEDAEAWRAIRAHYQRIRPDLKVPPSNRRQALFPHGVSSLDNDRGTAPGLFGQIGTCFIACFPGVPHEMKAMLERFVKGLPKLFPEMRVPTIGELYLTGIGESSAQGLLGKLITESDPQVGITASELGHLTMRVVGRRAEVSSRMKKLRRCLKEYLLPEAGLAASLIARLAAARMTVTAAESITGGRVAALLTSVPGSSRVVRETVVAYHDRTKIDRLGVPAALIRRHGVVSEAVASAMAFGALKHSGADVAIATTGIAGPDGGSAKTPVGTMWMAVATGKKVTTRMSHLIGSRERMQARTASLALQLAWETLLRA